MPKTFAFFRPDPRASVKLQEREFEQRDVRFDEVFYASNKHEEIGDLIEALRTGDVLCVYTLGIIPEPRSRGKEDRPARLERRVSEMLSEGVTIHEVLSGRVLGPSDVDAVQCAWDAKRFIGGRGRAPGQKGKKRGPKSALSGLSEIAIAEAKVIWKSNDYDTNADALEAMGDPWTKDIARHKFGPSGRD